MVRKLKGTASAVAVAVALGTATLVNSSAALATDQFVGQIQYFPYNFAPNGWAFCNGQLMAISQNTALFSLLGTQFGGNGISNFALPNLQGRFPVGQGQGPGLSDYVMGQEGGSATNTLTTSEMPQHSHPIGGTLTVSGSPTATLRANSADGDQNAPAAHSVAPGGSRTLQFNTAAPSVAMNAGSITVANTLSATLPAQTGVAGGGQPYNNLPPYLAVNCNIALVGIFPARN